jgi:rod shape determining protein RodA
MTPLIRKLLAMNWLLVAMLLGLSLYGIYAIYSATWMRPESALADAWHKQTTWLGIGMVVFFVTSLIHYRWVLWGAIPAYLTGIGALIYTKFHGVERFGARSWIEFQGFNLQTSQVALVGGILMLSMFLATTRRLHPVLRIAASGVLVTVPLLMILVQPDLGSVIIWVPMFVAMLFVGGIPKRYMLAMLLLGLGLLPLMINFGLKDHQRARLTTFIDPDYDPLGISWNINRSLEAIGTGGWTGKGFKAPDTLNEMGMIGKDIAHNDFIFAVLGEQHGFLGGIALLGAFATLLLLCLYIAFSAADLLGALLATGFTAVVFAHVFQNIGMTIAITPITGVPLPFISYGGTFLVVILFGMGIIQSVGVHRNEALRTNDRDAD